ncbi:MAG: glycosyltransferase, partial [Lachnospiraceae bacterium]|nr:glycosyltransferase [Lachnospiraceae bacterium]
IMPSILLYDFLNAYIQHDLISALTETGFRCHNIPARGILKDKYHDEAFSARIKQDLSEGDYSCIITANFYPIVAKACYDNNLPYLAWIYDSPPDLPTTEGMDYPTNYLFFFSKTDWEKYARLGLPAYHLPLAVNVKRLSTILPNHEKYGAQVSLVGNLYSDSVLPILQDQMNDYQKGFTDALLNLTQKLYGAYVLDEAVTKEFVAAVQREFQKGPLSYLKPTRSELAWAIASEATYEERLTLLRLMGDRYDTALYCGRINDTIRKILDNVSIRSHVDYLAEMPQVFKSSDINLCPVLKANIGGIPLRALDIMGCRAFLLSSYQPALAEVFQNGEEIVFYESIEEATEIAGFYLKHPEERERIAENGFQRIVQDFRYEDRVKAMLKTIGMI